MRKSIFAAALALPLFTSLTAQADFDVSPGVASGKIVTDAFEDSSSTTISNVRVFGYEFGEDPMDPYFAEDPGFHPLPGAGVPAATTISGKSFSPLTYWTGSAFGALPAGETLDLKRGNVTITLGAAGNAGPIVIETTDANGEFDEHLESTLKGINPANPSNGIYLFNMTLSAPGLTDSDPVYILYNNGLDDEEFDEAVTYARDTFAPGTTLVPEPASLALFPLLGLMLRRKR